MRKLMCLALLTAAACVDLPDWSDGPPPADVFEPNEEAASATELGPVEPGDITVGRLNLHSATDEDWFRFEVEPSARLDIRLLDDATDDRAREAELVITRDEGIVTVRVHGAASTEPYRLVIDVR